jgi:predicted hydrocarbon binding protein
VKELGGLGNENGLRKIKSVEEFKDFKKKIKKLGQTVQEFQKEEEDYFNINGCYSCCDVMQIVWGRRKCQTSIGVFKKQKNYIRKATERMKEREEMGVKK